MEDDSRASSIAAVAQRTARGQARWRWGSEKSLGQAASASGTIHSRKRANHMSPAASHPTILCKRSETKSTLNRISNCAYMDVPTACGTELGRPARDNLRHIGFANRRHCARLWQVENLTGSEVIPICSGFLSFGGD